MPRYQRGSVYLTGRKQKVWYAMFREDVRSSDGEMARRQRNVRLGTLSELPTKNAARNKLADLLRTSNAPANMSANMDFRTLVERWQKAEGPTMKPSTFDHHRTALPGYVLPVFKNRKIAAISREDVQIFLAENAKKYSQSTLKSMKVAMSKTLGWAEDCNWISKNPCRRIKLPRETGGKRVVRTALSAEQVAAIAGKLREPHATLVLFLYESGLRIGEAVAVRWSDFEGNVLHVTRRVYNGKEHAVKTTHSVRKIPIDPNLLERMRQHGGSDLIFTSTTGTHIEPRNALRRYVQPASRELGIKIGGFHDFRHSLTTQMRRNGTHAKVISGILGHATVDLALNVYDHADVEDFKQPLADIAGLLRDVTKITAA